MIKGKYKIYLQDILLSAQTNCVLKIKVKGVINPIITAVDTVLENEIILEPTCLYGYNLEKRRISFSEIESVTRYRTRFSNPLFVKMRYVKNNIGALLKPNAAQ